MLNGPVNHGHVPLLSRSPSSWIMVRVGRARLCVGRLSMSCILHRTVLTVNLSIVLGLTSCALFLTKESRYLRSAEDHATESEVRQHLGKPADVTLDGTGQSVWQYHTRRRIQQGTNNAWTTIEAWVCDSYRLTFDEHRVLREWSHTSHEC